jgi:Protein of unknown function (DUF3455)
MKRIRVFLRATGLVLFWGWSLQNLLAEPPQPGPVPDRLKPPVGQVVLAKLRAEGVQIYVWKAAPGKAGWSLKAPDADLFDEAGKKAGRHYGGPTWEALDGSKVMGKLQASAPAPRAGAIPWLLVRARSHEGKGVFSKVTWIQRMDTEGGVPPVPQGKPPRVGQETRVKYRATYVLYRAAD